MNVSLPIAAVLLDLGFPSAAVKAVPILARTASLLAHLAEEQQQPLGFLMAAGAEEAIAYERPTGDARARGRGSSVGGAARADDAAYRDAARLPASSARPSTARSWRRRASARRGDAGGLEEIARCRSPRSASCRQTCTPDEPVRRASLRRAGEIVRIYSTSGTTGTPSYIPLTAGDLDNWVTGSARSYAASGVERRAADRLDLQRRAVRRRRRARGLRPDRPLPHPGRHGQHRAAAARDRAPRARSRGAHAVVRRVPRRVGGRAGSTSRARPSSACSSRASPAAASRRSARSSRRAGARRSPRRWASATSASRSGASARSRTACTSARAASSTPS